MQTDTFKIAVVARMKHGVLHEAIEKRGWTVKQAAEFLGIPQSTLCSVINLKRKVPFIFSRKDDAETKRKARELTEKLMELTERTVEDLFPESVRTEEFLDTPKTFERTADIPLDRLLGYRETLALPAAPDEMLMREESEVALDVSLNELSAREKEIVNLRFFKDRTLREVGEKFGLSQENIRQKQNSALEKMRKALQKQKI